MTRKEETQYAAHAYVDNWFEEHGIDPEVHPIDVQISVVDFTKGAEWANKTLLEKLREFIDHHTDIKDVYKFINVMEE